MFPLFLLLACGLSAQNTDDSSSVVDSTAEGDSDTDTDADTDIDLPCGQGGFAQQAEQWALPQLGADSDPAALRTTSGSDSVTCASGGTGTVSWTTTDLNDDRWPDLLVTRDECDALVSLVQWNVHYGAQGGFASASQSWSIPILGASRDPAALTAASGSDTVACTGSDNGTVSWTTMDLSGDGVLDLVVHRNTCEALVSLAEWHVYQGSASGFGDKSSFSLPQLGGDTDPAYLINTSGSESVACQSGGTGAVSWSLQDMTGDGAVDLVVPQDSCDALVSLVKWQVYENSGTGFGTPRDWEIPILGASSDPAQLTALSGSDTVACAGGGSGTVAWSTTELTGDDWPDLVVHQDDCDVLVGLASWRVYPGSEGGFGAPVSWTLPQLGADTDPAVLNRLSGSDSVACSQGGSGTVTWQLADMTGDGQADLIAPRFDCDALVSLAWWEIYAGQDGGFASKASWTLPLLGDASSPADLSSLTSSGAAACSGGGSGSLSWITGPLDSDGIPDLYVTSNTCDPLVSLAWWESYPGVCE
ncbi:MAG: hypothetical protein VX899_02745 [Myxococcota bacterium]|nr:hypothetical protein [Myxococcota bacterium]